MIIIRKYQDQFQVSFDAFLQEKECLINANEMAKIFDKRVFNFLRLDSTKETILALEKRYGNGKFDEKKSFQGSDVSLETDENMPDISENISENIIKVVHGGRNNGTWMHEILAIEFAMWLDVDFKIWVLEIIREILFGYARKRTLSFQRTIKLKKEMDELKDKTDPDGNDFKRYIEIENELNGEKSGRRKISIDESKEIELLLFSDNQ